MLKLYCCVLFGLKKKLKLKKIRKNCLKIKLDKTTCQMEHDPFVWSPAMSADRDSLTQHCLSAETITLGLWGLK